eukprot:CAMPEP_0172464082 /NCGR_PEP_ID=MMETSP1065-20121228/49295_1 /TAXON_ID=265537 /ORGANISM="Amphiprora paludosa, Strain CCMP125" /LENGTH=37 /DNA_ID= /DNA_START= /DNA_END= /DNA_ORIENTATION=
MCGFESEQKGSNSSGAKDQSRAAGRCGKDDEKVEDDE